jgi:hypothetical protein
MAALVDVALRLGNYDLASAFEKSLLRETSRSEDRTLIEKKLAEIRAAERSYQIRMAALLRLDNSNVNKSFYASQMHEEE